VGVEHRAQPVGDHLEPLGPGQGGVDGAVDLGEDAVKDQVLELLLVADVAVERAGDDPEAGGQGAHGQRLDAVVGDDREGLGDHAPAGEWGAAVVVGQGRAEPQRARAPVGRALAAGRGGVLGGGCRGWLVHALLPHVHFCER
jgi:hypothetical protein